MLEQHRRMANTSYGGDMFANIKSDSLPYTIIIISIIVETKQMDARELQQLQINRWFLMVP